MTKELIEEALRWANGHPNRRSSELMRELAEALEVRQPSEEGEYILRLIETIKQTGGSVEVSGVKIMPCDEFGRTAAVPDAALDAVARVREIHRPTMPGYGPKACVHDGRAWPCQTVAALDGAPEPEEKP